MAAISSTSISSDNTYYKYKLQQQDDILPPILAKFPPSAPEIVKFRIHVRDMLHANVVTDETNAVVASLQVEDDVYRLLTYKFSPMGVPENCQREILAPAILNFAKRILADPQNAGHKWIGVVVEITILAPNHRHKEEDEDQNQSKSSSSDIVRGSVKEDLDTSNLECVICYEKLSVSVNFASLPCSHMYHWHCIVRWLQKGDRCPTCRRNMWPP